MKLAGFPVTTPWFRRSLEAEYTEEQIRAMEPRNARLDGITDKRGVMKTARLTVDGRVFEATSQTAGEALRKVLARRDAAMALDDAPQIVSLFTPDTAA